MAIAETEILVAELVAPVDAGRQILARVEGAQRQVVRTRRWSRGVFAAAAGLVLLALAAWLDFRLELALTARLAGLGAISVSIAWLARRGGPRWAGGIGIDETASELERRLNHLGQRLRTTLDYQRAEARPARAAAPLVRALEEETFALTRSADFHQVVEKRPLVMAAALLAGVSLAWLIALASSAEWRIAAGRALLLPWHYSTVTYEPREATIKAGESLEVTAHVAGRPIRSALVRYRPAGTDEAWRELEFQPERPDDADDSPSAPPTRARRVALQGKLAVTLDDCQHDLEFEVLAGPVELPPGHVRVLQPLTIESFSAQATPPAYVKKPVETFDRWTFKVLEGTTVEFQVGLNRAAAEARLTPVRSAAENGPGKGTPAAENSQDAGAASLELVADGPKLTGVLRDLRRSDVWELTAKTADGIELEPQRLAIRVQLDGRATVRFLEPTEELEVIATAEVPFVVEAADDLGLVRVGIAAQVGDGPLQTLWEQAIGESEPGATVRGEATLALENFRLTHQDGVTYHAFADDRYFEEDRRTTTPLRFIDIRPFKQEFQLQESGES